MMEVVGGATVAVGGQGSPDTAVGVGVWVPVGARWFRHGGGTPPLSLAEPTGRYLSFHEREELGLLRAKGFGIRAIARELERDPGTVSRELRRDAATRAAGTSSTEPRSLSGRRRRRPGDPSRRSSPRTRR